jgi:ATP-dependent DNA ligase
MRHPPGWPNRIQSDPECQRHRTVHPVYFLFDLLFVDGESLLEMQLIERKAGYLVL